MQAGEGLQGALVAAAPGQGLVQALLGLLQGSTGLGVLALLGPAVGFGVPDLALEGPGLVALGIPLTDGAGLLAGRVELAVEGGVDGPGPGPAPAGRIPLGQEGQGGVMEAAVQVGLQGLEGLGGQGGSAPPQVLVVDADEGQSQGVGGLGVAEARVPGSLEGHPRAGPVPQQLQGAAPGEGGRATLPGGGLQARRMGPYLAAHRGQVVGR